jgi:hypothetical protein
MDKATERYIQLIKNAQTEYSEQYFAVAIPGFMSKKFIAYCAMKGDLEMVLNYIEFLKTRPLDLTIKSSLTFSIIALYGKCFTDASKNSYPKLEPNVLFVDQEDFFKTHKFLMDLRHQFIAHRGKTESEIGIAFMLIPKKVGDSQSQIKFNQIKQYSFDIEKLIEFEHLMKYIISDLEKKIQKSGQKLYDGLLENFTPEQLTFMAINNAKDNPTQKEQ